MSTAAVAYKYVTLPLAPEWGFDMPAAREGTVFWFPLNYTCDRIGVGKRDQIDKLKADARFKGALREIPFKLSAAGWRTCQAIRRDKFPLWILGIDPSRCVLDTSETLDRFQQDVCSMADEALFSGGRRAATTRVKIDPTAHVSVEVHGACPDCGCPIVAIVENGKTEILREIAREE